MSNNIIEQRKQAETRIIAKAWSDPDFKAKLLHDPKATLIEFLNSEGFDIDMTMAEQFSVNVVEEDPTNLTFVLPVNPAALELSDEMLDLVSGGGGGNC